MQRQLAVGVAALAALVALAVAMGTTGSSTDEPEAPVAERSTSTTLAIVEGEVPQDKELALSSRDEHVVVFVARDLTRPQIEELGARFNADPRVVAWDFRDHEESLAEFQQLFADNEEMLAEFEADPTLVPMSYRLALDRSVTDDEADELVDELADEGNVLKVVLSPRWEDRGGRRGG